MKKIVLLLVGVLVVVAGAWAALVLTGSGSKFSVSKPSPHKSVAGSAKGTSNSTGPQPSARSDPGAGRSTSASSGFSDFNSDAEFEDRELVVVDPPNNFADVAARLGYSVLENVPLAALAMNVFRVRVPDGTAMAAARRSMAAQFTSAIVDFNHRYEPSQSTKRNTLKRRRPAGVSVIDALRQAKAASIAQASVGWKNVPPTCGQGVRLGMVDTPVDLTHPALAGQRVEFRTFHNPNLRLSPADHGTAIAAILVGRPSEDGWGGLLPGAELKAANMFELNEIGKRVGNVISLLKSLNWLATQNVHAVNLSIAGAQNRGLARAIDQARDKGLVMIAAAGNWGRADKPAYPAAFEDVMAVTAVGTDRRIFRYANRGNYIDFAQPGVRMWTAVPGGGRYQSGTSLAVPFITALVGLEVAHGGTRNPDKLRRELSGAAVDLGTPGKDDTFGWGFVEKQPGCRR